MPINRRLLPDADNTTNDMTYTLWRNDECLGTIIKEFPSEDAVVFGLFNPTQKFTDLGPFMQTRMAIGEGRVFVSRTGGAIRPGPIALRKLRPDEAAGLRPADQFVLRDTANEAIDVDLISLWSVPSDRVEALRAEWERAESGPQVVWILSASRHPAPPSADV